MQVEKTKSGGKIWLGFSKGASICCATFRGHIRRSKRLAVDSDLAARDGTVWIGSNRPGLLSRTDFLVISENVCQGIMLRLSSKVTLVVYG